MVNGLQDQGLEPGTSEKRRIFVVAYIVYRFIAALRPSIFENQIL